MSQTKQKTKMGKKKKALRLAKRWGREVPIMALKFVSLMAAIVVLGLMFSAMQAIEALWLRVVLSLAIASGMILMCYHDGLTKGIKDAGASRFYADAQSKGIALEEKDDAACYHVLKAVCAALCVFALPVAIAAYIALTTKGHTYALQDLPAWLTASYGSRADVMAPLSAYMQNASLTATDVLRILVRLPVMIYINLFSDPVTMGGLIDKTVPLFLLTYPVAYLAGYLTAPYANRKREKMNRRAKKVAVRRTQKSTLAKTLVGEQHGVHYGHRKDEEKHKKKELV
ncbi:MAG: hypothetical protein IJ381_01705 [Clostridia bacterium]|nr:hypothetical protein [Clostridia bacterium]